MTALRSDSHDALFGAQFSTSSTYRSEFQVVREKAENANLSELACFAQSLHERLSYRNSTLPLLALEKQETITKLDQEVMAKFNPTEGETLGQHQVKLLKLILDYELANDKDGKWALTQGGLVQVEGDFVQIFDYYTGEHRKDLKDLTSEFADFFLDPNELSAAEQAAKENNEPKEKWIHMFAAPKITPLWYFTVSLFRILQDGEYTLSPADAYWLGIVDEVIDSKLPCLRIILESQPGPAESKAAQ